MENPIKIDDFRVPPPSQPCTIHFLLHEIRNPGHKLYTRRRAAPSSRSSVSAAAMPS